MVTYFSVTCCSSIVLALSSGDTTSNLFLGNYKITNQMHNNRSVMHEFIKCFKINTFH